MAVWLGAGSVAAAPGYSQEPVDRAALVEDILDLSRLKHQLTHIPGLIQSHLLEGTRLEAWRVSDILTRSFQADAVYGALRKNFLAGFDDAQLLALAEFLRSPLARKMSGLMVGASSPERVPAMRRFAAELRTSLPPAARMAAVDRLDVALKGTDLWVEIALAINREEAEMAPDGPAKKPPAQEALEDVLMQKRTQFYRAAKPNTAIGMLFAYHTVPDSAIHQYADFWESDLGQRFTRTVQRTLLDAVGATTARAALEIVAATKDGEERLLTPAQKWALAASALLAERNRARHDVLGELEPTPANIRGWKRGLRLWWGVHTRADLLARLRWLEEQGHRKEFERLGDVLGSLDDAQRATLEARRLGDEELDHRLTIVEQHYARLATKGLLGWDLSRYISLCRWGYLVGYLSRDEAWDRIMPVARRLQETFDSWGDLGENYLVGRQFWSLEETKKNGQLYDAAYRKLLSEPQSPWNQTPWTLSLD